MVCYRSQALDLLFSMRFFARDLSGNRSGVTILCLQHPLKVSGTTLTIHYKITTIPIGTFTPQKIQDVLEF